MTSRDFCFWLQGFFELARTQSLSENQVSMIERHLALVFQHEIDPSMGPAKVQDALDAIHKPDPDHKMPDHSGALYDLKPPFLGATGIHATSDHLTKPQDGPIRYRC